MSNKFKNTIFNFDDNNEQSNNDLSNNKERINSQSKTPDVNSKNENTNENCNSKENIKDDDVWDLPFFLQQKDN